MLVPVVLMGAKVTLFVAVGAIRIAFPVFKMDAGDLADMLDGDDARARGGHGV